MNKIYQAIQQIYTDYGLLQMLIVAALIVALCVIVLAIFQYAFGFTVQEMFEQFKLYFPPAGA